MTPTQKQSLLQSIHDARAPIAAFSIGVIGFALPSIRQLLLPGEGNKVIFPTEQCPVIKTDQNNKVNASGHYELQLDPSLEYVLSDSRNSFAFINLSVKAALLHVGDAFSGVEYFDRSPELEFLRHTRNAVAHGNRFNITSPLKRPAFFRSYSISETLHGRQLLKDREGDGYLYAGDALALLDFLEIKIAASC